jgi:hypothetical protein
MLSYYLRLCLPSRFFPSLFQTKMFYAFLISPMCTHPFNYPNNILGVYKSPEWSYESKIMLSHYAFIYLDNIPISVELGYEC